MKSTDYRNNIEAGHCTYSRVGEQLRHDRQLQQSRISKNDINCKTHDLLFI
jgi:hypothetical protein